MEVKSLSVNYRLIGNDPSDVALRGFAASQVAISNAMFKGVMSYHRKIIMFDGSELNIIKSGSQTNVYIRKVIQEEVEEVLQVFRLYYIPMYSPTYHIGEGIIESPVSPGVPGSFTSNVLRDQALHRNQRGFKKPKLDFQGVPYPANFLNNRLGEQRDYEGFLDEFTDQTMLNTNIDIEGYKVRSVDYPQDKDGSNPAELDLVGEIDQRFKGGDIVSFRGPSCRGVPAVSLGRQLYRYSINPVTLVNNNIVGSPTTSNVLTEYPSSYGTVMTRRGLFYLEIATRRVFLDGKELLRVLGTGKVIGVSRLSLTSLNGPSEVAYVVFFYEGSEFETVANRENDIDLLFSIKAEVFTYNSTNSEWEVLAPCTFVNTSPGNNYSLDGDVIKSSPAYPIFFSESGLKGITTYRDNGAGREPILRDEPPEAPFQYRPDENSYATLRIDLSGLTLNNFEVSFTNVSEPETIDWNSAQLEFVQVGDTSTGELHTEGSTKISSDFIQGTEEEVFVKEYVKRDYIVTTITESGLDASSSTSTYVETTDDVIDPPGGFTDSPPIVRHSVMTYYTSSRQTTSSEQTHEKKYTISHVPQSLGIPEERFDGHSGSFIEVPQIPPTGPVGPSGLYEPEAQETVLVESKARDFSTTESNLDIKLDTIVDANGTVRNPGGIVILPVHIEVIGDPIADPGFGTPSNPIPMYSTLKFGGITTDETSEVDVTRPVAFDLRFLKTSFFLGNRSQSGGYIPQTYRTPTGESFNIFDDPYSSASLEANVFRSVCIPGYGVKDMKKEFAFSELGIGDNHFQSNKYLRPLYDRTGIVRLVEDTNNPGVTPDAGGGAGKIPIIWHGYTWWPREVWQTTLIGLSWKDDTFFFSHPGWTHLPEYPFNFESTMENPEEVDDLFEGMDISPEIYETDPHTIDDREDFINLSQYKGLILDK